MHVGDKKIEPVFPSGIAASKTANLLSCDAQAPDHAAAIEVAVNEFQTMVELNPTGNVALTADIAEYLQPGAMLHLHIISDGSVRTITPGAGFVGPAIATVANKQHAASYMYNGTAFVQMGAAVQLD